MKQFSILGSLLSLSLSFSAEAANQAVCMESGEASGQTSPLIYADYTQTGNSSSVTLKSVEFDGSVLSKVTLEGSEPDLLITNATDENGERYVIITSMAPAPLSEGGSLKLRVLVCSPSN